MNRGERIRTSDFLLPKQALCQTELRPVKSNLLDCTLDAHAGSMHSLFSRRKTRNGEPARVAEMKDLGLSNLDACCRSRQPSSPRMQVDDPITRKIQRRWSGSPYPGITTPRLRLSSNSQPVRFRVLVRTGATVPPYVSPSWTNPGDPNSGPPVLDRDPRGRMGECQGRR